MKKKVGIYYDYQNIYDASYDLEEYKNQIDFIEDYCSKLGKIEIKNLYLMEGKYKDENKIVETHQKEYSYEIIFGPYKKDIDTLMVSDFMDDSSKNIIDICVVISGDTDFVAPIERVLKRKKKFMCYAIVEHIANIRVLQKVARYFKFCPKNVENVREKARLVRYVINVMERESLTQNVDIAMELGGA